MNVLFFCQSALWIFCKKITQILIRKPLIFRSKCFNFVVLFFNYFYEIKTINWKQLLKRHWISRIRPVWSKALLYAQWVAKDPSFLHLDSEKIRLTWVLAGRTLILLVLSCCGSNVKKRNQPVEPRWARRRQSISPHQTTTNVTTAKTRCGTNTPGRCHHLNVSK